MVKALHEPIIARAELLDMEEILKLQYAAYQSEALLYGDFTIQPLTQTLDEIIAEYNKGVVLKAVRDGEIIGSVRAYAHGGTAYIGKLIVHPKYQGKGLGKCLLSAIEREYPHRRYELFTGGKSSKNLRLYETAGYTRFRDEAGASGIVLVFLEKGGLFLRETAHIDFSSPNIHEKAAELFDGISDEKQKARIAYEYVRDEIPHSFDIDAKIVTAKASDVLKHKTGVCHAKANLLAALLRAQGIPTGFCFQRITLADDDSQGYAVHCYNAVFLGGGWIKVDARGNKPGVNARFSLGDPALAYPCRPEYDEYFWPGIYACPHAETMAVLERAASLLDVIQTIPDQITVPPDVVE